MIISHKYKYIFIKTNKTGGTSIEIALSQYCGPNDTITPISSKDEHTRSQLGARGPQNYHSPYRDYGVRDLAMRVLKGEKKERFYNHVSAGEIKRCLPDAVWRDYFKFCFERNPWDRVISLYYWKWRSEPRPSLSEFVRSDAIQVLKKRGIRLYTIDGEVAVDRVCRFENIEGELDEIRTTLGIPDRLQLPYSKSDSRIDRRHYRDVYNEADAAIVGDLFSDEIALLGYEY